jgi:hypothetical protein
MSGKGHEYWIYHQPSSRMCYHRSTVIFCNILFFPLSECIYSYMTMAARSVSTAIKRSTYRVRDTFGEWEHRRINVAPNNIAANVGCKMCHKTAKTTVTCSITPPAIVLEYIQNPKRTWNRWCDVRLYLWCVFHMPMVQLEETILFYALVPQHSFRWYFSKIW